VAVGAIVPFPGTQFEEALASVSPDLLREMINGFGGGPLHSGSHHRHGMTCRPSRHQAVRSCGCRAPCLVPSTT
jgi:hypothetical protein